MLQFELPASTNRILCLGAHADDIEIGCGGTLLKWRQQYPDLQVHWVVFSAEGQRASEAQNSARRMLGQAAHEISVQDFRTSYFPFDAAKIKEFFESLKVVTPDVIFTHYRDDRHQDHRVLSDLAWNTFRDHFILEYEIPKYDGDFGAPNIFVPLTDELAQKKAAHVFESFPSQSDKHWFSEETFLALMRLRGVECASRYAEAFYCRKLALA